MDGSSFDRYLWLHIKAMLASRPPQSLFIHICYIPQSPCWPLTPSPSCWASLLFHSYDPNSPQSPSGSSQAPRASSSLCCHPPRAPPYLSLHLTLLLFLLLGNACPWRPLPHRGLVCTSDPGSPRLLSAEHSLGTYRSPSPTQALLPTATPPGTASCIPPGPTAFTAGVSYFLLPGTR